MRPHAHALVLVLAAFGCDGESRNPGPSDQGPVSPDPTNPPGVGTAPPNSDYCAMATEVICGRVLACFSDPTFHEECIADLGTSCPGEAPCNPGEIFHPELFDECLASIPGLSCNDLDRGDLGACDEMCERPRS